MALILGGIILGLVISVFTLEYEGWTYIRHNKLGEEVQVINEIDYNLVANSFMIMIASGLVIYMTLTLIEKNKKV